MKDDILIINADDLGKSHDVNRAILAAFQAGMCSSATLMANMPGFEEACQMAHEQRLLDRVGVHLVLTEGLPLTEPIRRCRRFVDAAGRLALSRGKPLLWLRSDEREAVAGELLAQIRRCRAAGLPLTHVDSHHHSHTEWALFRIVLRLMRQERIPYCRLTRNCGRIDPLRRVYKHLLNARIRRARLAGTRFFGSVQDVLSLVAGHPGHLSAEAMTHPCYNAEGELWDDCERASLADLVSQLPGYRQAISYGMLSAVSTTV